MCETSFNFAKVVESINSTIIGLHFREDLIFVMITLSSRQCNLNMIPLSTIILETQSNFHPKIGLSHYIGSSRLNQDFLANPYVTKLGWLLEVFNNMALTTTKPYHL